MKLVNGNEIAQGFLAKLAEKIQASGITPRLDIVQVGKNFASDVYVGKKKEWGENAGVVVTVHKFDEISENKLIEELNLLNRNSDVHGIIVQLPLPKEINAENIFLNIWPEKDVDGLNPISLGSLWQKSSTGFASATPLAVIECLKHIAIYQDDMFSVSEMRDEVVEKELHAYLSGKKVLIINRSNIVGKPLAALLLKYDATVTIAHSKSNEIDKLCLNSDIIISGTGKPKFITKELIPENAVLIDVGINSTAEGIGGDIDYRGAENKIDWLTPVPGGVGPLTVCMLLENTFIAAKNSQITIN